MLASGRVYIPPQLSRLVVRSGATSGPGSNQGSESGCKGFGISFIGGRYLRPGGCRHVPTRPSPAAANLLRQCSRTWGPNFRQLFAYPILCQGVPLAPVPCAAIKIFWISFYFVHS